MKKLSLLLALSAIAGAANAVTIFDQIGDSVDTSTTSYGAASQDFETAYNQYDIAAIDDFTTTSSYVLTTAETAIFPNSTSFSTAGITAWTVSIYSGATGTTASSLSGDVKTYTLAPSAATYTATVGGYYDVVLNLGSSYTLPAGSYWLGITPSVAYATYGQTYVSQSSIAAGTALNARQINPSNGFGGGTNFAASGATAGIGANLQYRLTANPVPEPSAFAALGLGAVAVLRRRKKA